MDMWKQTGIIVGLVATIIGGLFAGAKLFSAIAAIEFVTQAQASGIVRSCVDADTIVKADFAVRLDYLEEKMMTDSVNNQRSHDGIQKSLDRIYDVVIRRR